MRKNRGFSSALLVLMTLLLLLISVLPVVAGEYRIGKRDVLDVSAWGHPDLHIQSQVLPNGVLFFPLAGEVEVVGKTIAEIQEILAEKLSVYLIDPQVMVSVVSVTPLQVKVIGEVNRPGIYEVTPGARVLDLITMAGGPTSRAELARVKVSSAYNPNGIEVKLGKGERFATDLDIGPELEDGMTVYVQETVRPDWAKVALYITIVKGLMDIFGL